MKNWQFHKSLKNRGLNTAKLAALIGSCRTHVCQVLNNEPGRGWLTRRKLALHLTSEELALLGWNAEGQIVPRETLSQPNFTPAGRRALSEAPVSVVQAGSEARQESAAGDFDAAVAGKPAAACSAALLPATSGAEGELGCETNRWVGARPAAHHGPSASNFPAGEVPAGEQNANQQTKEQT